MTDVEILQKAIKLAIKNGYKLLDDDGNTIDIDEVSFEDSVEDKSYYTVFFSHDFAKAFWGEEHNWKEVTPFNTECKKCGMVGETGWSVVDRCWENALKQMVLEENPIKYLEKFL